MPFSSSRWWSLPVLIGAVSLLPLTAFWAPRPILARPAIDPERVYYGNPENYSRPAAVERELVYRRIPAYREILDRSLTARDPDYWPLLRKANQAFVRALRHVCRSSGHDLVCEARPSASPTGEVPDITPSVIAAVEKGHLPAAAGTRT